MADKFFIDDDDVADDYRDDNSAAVLSPLPLGQTVTAPPLYCICAGASLFVVVTANSAAHGGESVPIANTGIVTESLRAILTELGQPITT